jgi:hypothetical protein
MVGRAWPPQEHPQRHVFYEPHPTADNDIIEMGIIGNRKHAMKSNRNGQKYAEYDGVADLFKDGYS